MADISISVLSYTIVIDEDKFQRIKELIVNKLKLDPLGLDATIDDVDVETMRRSLKESLPEVPTLTSGALTFRGPLGLVETFILDPTTWYTAGADQTLVDGLIVPAAFLWATSVDTNATFSSDDLVTDKEAEYYIDRMVHAVQRALSGQEQGY